MRKNLRHLRNLRDKKKRPNKYLCISVKSVGLFPISGGICNDRTGRICEICVTKKNRSTQMILPDFILFIWSFHYLIIPLQASIKWYTFKLEYKRKWSSKILSAS